MQVCLRAHCQRQRGWPVVCPPWGSSQEDQQVREIQLLLVVEDGGDGEALEGGGIELRRCFVAIDADPGQRQLLEAGKFLPLLRVSCQLARVRTSLTTTSPVPACPG